MLVILLGEERERENGGDRKTFEIQRLLQFALAFFSLLFTFHQRKKFVVVVESLFVEVLFRSLFVCACDFTSSPGVCDTTLLKERLISSKKNDMERVEEQKKGSFLERRKERNTTTKSTKKDYDFNFSFLRVPKIRSGHWNGNA